MFEVEKLRVNRSLVERAAEVVVRRLELEEEVRQLQVSKEKIRQLLEQKQELEMWLLQVPRTLLPAVVDKFRDAEWVRSFWQHKADLENTGEEMEERILYLGSQECRPHPNYVMDVVENRLWGDQEEEAVEEEEEVEKEEEGSVISASLWWAFYVLLVFIAYVCS